MRSRTESVLIRLTKTEKSKLKSQAEIAGLKMEPFVRKLIMGVDIRPRPPDNISRLLREINAIGNNINQIARMANTCKNVSSNDIDEVLKLLGEISLGTVRMCCIPQ